jgi:hypothetical protein
VTLKKETIVPTGEFGLFTGTMVVCADGSWWYESTTQYWSVDRHTPVYEEQDGLEGPAVINPPTPESEKTGADE